MEFYGEGDVLVSLLACMEWVYGKILGGLGGSFVVIPDLKWKMAQRLDFDMIFGVGIWSLMIPDKNGDGNNYTNSHSNERYKFTTQEITPKGYKILPPKGLQ